MDAIIDAATGARCFQTMVPMRDGTRLNTFVFLPAAGGPHFPVILHRTPYGIAAADARDKFDCTKAWLPNPAEPMRGSILRGWKAIVAQGYAAVYQDCRGRHGSGGEDRVYADDAADGYDTLDWIALPQIVLVPIVALLLRRVDARLLLVLGFATIAIGSWMDTGLTHDWVTRDFIPSQCVSAVGLAFAITALITYAIANITPAQAAAIAATIQIARLIGSEFGSALIQTFVRVREQTYSQLIGWHLTSGSAATEGITAQLAAPFGSRQTGLGDSGAQGLGVLAVRVQHEAYVLAYIDAFWLIAWVSLAGILLVLFLHRPPPNPLTPPRIQV